MVKYLAILSSVCSLFVLSWGLSRWYGPRNCINSTVVSKVVIAPEGDTISTCSFEKIMIDPIPNIVREFPDVLKRIEALEIVADQTGQTLKPVQITIHKNQAQYLVIQDNLLSISLDLVNMPGLLERSVLYAKLESENPLSSAIIADFLWSEIIGPEPIPLPSSWMDKVQTIRRYCQSADVLVAHYDFCQIRNSFDDSYITVSDEQPIHWALAPLFTNALRSIYRESGWIEKKQMLENLMFLGELSDTTLEEILSNDDPVESNKVFEGLLESWLMPVMPAQHMVESYLAKIRVPKKKSYDLIYVGRGSREVFPVDFSDYPAGESGRSTVVQEGTRFYFLPSDVPVQFSRPKLFATGMINNVIYVSCEMPSPSALLEFKNFTARVIYVKQCDTDEVDWHEVHRIGLGEYLRQNEDAQFVEFNLNAIVLANRLRGPLKKSEDFTAWQRWLMWQKIVDDEGPSVQRPLSAIDGVSRFRIF